MVLLCRSSGLCWSAHVSTCCRAVSKESQNRYSKSAKDWGWREFLQLHTLFDQEAGFLVADSVVFAAEVLVLKEFSEAKQVCLVAAYLQCIIKARHTAGLYNAQPGRELLWQLQHDNCVILAIAVGSCTSCASQIACTAGPVQCTSTAH